MLAARAVVPGWIANAVLEPTGIYALAAPLKSRSSSIRRPQHTLGQRRVRGAKRPRGDGRRSCRRGAGGHGQVAGEIIRICVRRQRWAGASTASGNKGGHRSIRARRVSAEVLRARGARARGLRFEHGCRGRHINNDRKATAAVMVKGEALRGERGILVQPADRFRLLRSTCPTFRLVIEHRTVDVLGRGRAGGG